MCHCTYYDWMHLLHLSYITMIQNAMHCLPQHLQQFTCIESLGDGVVVSTSRRACVSVCVRLCVQVGICALRHVCPQHGATAGPVPASWSLNLLRGSAAQWWEVGRTRNGTPTICPGLPSDRDVQLGRPSQGLTALHNPIHKTLLEGGGWGGGRGGGRLDVRERREVIGWECGGGGNFEGGGGDSSQRGGRNSGRAETRHAARLRRTGRQRQSLEVDKSGKDRIRVKEIHLRSWNRKKIVIDV